MGREWGRGGGDTKCNTLGLKCVAFFQLASRRDRGIGREREGADEGVSARMEWWEHNREPKQEIEGDRETVQDKELKRRPGPKANVKRKHNPH